MEANSLAVCKCGKPMNPEGGKMVCDCGYSYEIPRKLPPYSNMVLERDMLLAENKELRETIRRINKERR